MPLFNDPTPKPLDTEWALLAKIAQLLQDGCAGGGGGGGVTGISINGGPILTGDVSIATGNGVQAVNGDAGPLVLLDSGEIPEGVNLYYTAARFNAAFAAKTTTDLAEGANLYYTAARFNTAFATKTTTDLAEGANLYFTNARAIASTLTGFVAAPGTVTAADTVLTAFQKVVGNASASTLLNFDDTNANADASILINSGATEIIKVIGATTFVQVNTTRIHRGVTNSVLAMLSGTGKSDGAFLEVAGDTNATVGYLSFTTKGQSAGAGTFSILNAPLASLASVTRATMSWEGNWTYTPVWNDGAATFVGLMLDVSHTASAAGSLLLALEMSTLAKFSVTKNGKVSAYETTDAPFTNFSRLSLEPQAGNHLIRTEALGTGTLRILQVGTGPTAGANIVGVNAILHGGQGTGSALGGSILFQVSGTGGAGSGVNALFTLMTLTPVGAAGGTLTVGNARINQSGFVMDWPTSSSGAFQAGLNGTFGWTGTSLIYSQVNGVIRLTNNASTDFIRLQFGGTTNSFNAIGRDAVNGFTIQSAAATTTYNDNSTAASGTVANRYLFGLEAPTLTSTNATVTYTEASSVYIGGAPTASTNVTIGTAYALNVGAGTTLLANLTQRVAALFSVRSGANQRAGNTTLVAGTVTVANTTVTANTIVLLTRKTSGGTIGTAITYTVSAATSFTITSDSVLDTSVFSYFLIEVP